jgi:hypothetical protein
LEVMVPRDSMLSTSTRKEHRTGNRRPRWTIQSGPLVIEFIGLRQLR